MTLSSTPKSPHRLQENTPSTKLGMNDLPLSERPRERLASLGAEALSDAELLALILGNGTRGKSVLHLCQEILAHFGSLNRVGEAALEELCQIKGVGKAKAMQIAAAFGLGRRAACELNDMRIRISSPIHAYQLLRGALEHEKRECCHAILLDTRGCLIKKVQIAVGILNEVLVHPREVFHTAIRHCAHALILAHNHPSGDLNPSNADIALTKKLREVGILMEIALEDHLIIGRTGFISMRQKGFI